MMRNHPQNPGRWGLFLALTALYIVGGCAPTKVTSGAFVHVNRVGIDFQRGVSTKMDVQRILGAPTGFGNAIFPTDPNPREVWYYDDIEVTDIKSEGEGVVRANVRQQILLIFFKREVFDGYMWFSNAGTAEAKQ